MRDKRVLTKDQGLKFTVECGECDEPLDFTFTRQANGPYRLKVYGCEKCGGSLGSDLADEVETAMMEDDDD